VLPSTLTNSSSAARRKYPLMAIMVRNYND
jgi:hypothetical protein